MCVAEEGNGTRSVQKCGPGGKRRVENCGQILSQPGKSKSKSLPWQGACLPPLSCLHSLQAGTGHIGLVNPLFCSQKSVLSFVLQCSTLNMIILLRSIETYLQGFFYHILRSSYHPRNNFGKTLDSWWTIYETFMNNH